MKAGAEGINTTVCSYKRTLQMHEVRGVLTIILPEKELDYPKLTSGLGEEKA